MKEVGKRLKALRESIGISQVKMAEAIGSTQSSVNRYENGQSTPPVELFRHYADYFDVSLDYIKPKAAPEREEKRRFIEMCFDPRSPMNEKLKETLFRMMEGEQWKLWYTRYFSDSQWEESIESQIRECTAFAEKNGITILHHYIDGVFSVKTDNHLEFQNIHLEAR